MTTKRDVSQCELARHPHSGCIPVENDVLHASLAGSLRELQVCMVHVLTESDEEMKSFLSIDVEKHDLLLINSVQ